jgi:hypothetical protein
LLQSHSRITPLSPGRVDPVNLGGGSLRSGIQHFSHVQHTYVWDPKRTVEHLFLFLLWKGEKAP